MKKIIPLFLLCLLLSTVSLYADSGDFESLIKALAKSKDYSEQIEVLGAISNVEKFTTEEQDRLRKDLLEMSVNAENTVDPGTNTALLIQAVRLFPNDLRLSVKLAKAYVELGQYQQALAVDADILTKNGNQSNDYELVTVAHAIQGLGLMMTNNYKLAYNEFKTVIGRDKNWSGGYFLMGAYYFRVKDFKEAAKYLRKCQELNPVHKGAADMLVMLKKEGKI